MVSSREGERSRDTIMIGGHGLLTSGERDGGGRERDGVWPAVPLSSERVNRYDSCPEDH